jgi:bifunctional polynucleotide phosphatase/kinase
MEKLKWTITKDYIVATSIPLDSIRGCKIAAFDLDDTIIRTKSGKVFSENAYDWQLFSDTVGKKLVELICHDYSIVIISNQSKLTRPKVIDEKYRENIRNFKKKINSIHQHIGLDLTFLIASENNFFRKPGIGLWNLFRGNTKESFYCGDAGGLNERRLNGQIIKKDFSDTDLKFARNLKMRFVHRDEFVYDANYSAQNYTVNYPNVLTDLEEEEIDIEHSTIQEMVINVGYPGSGKSFFTYKFFPHSPCYKIINQDDIKSKAKCLKLTREYIEDKFSVVIDCTNVSKEERKVYIDIAKEYNIPVKCVFYDIDFEVCIHNTHYRSHMTDFRIKTIPRVVFDTMKKRFQKPVKSEGFVEIIVMKPNILAELHAISKMELIGFIIATDLREKYLMYYF